MTTKLNLDQIKRNIRQIAASSTRMVALIQDTAVGIALHAQECGDITQMSALLKAMGSGYRRDALITWAEKFFPIKVESTENDGPHTFGYGGGFKTIRCKQEHGPELWNIEGAASLLWMDAKKEAKLTPFDLDAAVKTAVATYNRRRTGEAEGGVKASALAEKLSKLVGVPLANVQPSVNTVPAAAPANKPKAKGKKA